MGGRVRLRDRVVYRIGRATLWLLAIVPEGIAYGSLGALGRLYFRFSKRRQAYALRFLRNAFPDRPDSELLDLARRSTANLFKVPLDMARATRLMDTGRLRELIDVSDVERKKPPPPFIGLSCHLGSWEMAAVGMAMMYGGAHLVGRLFKNPLLTRFIVANRAKAGLHMHARRGGIRGLARALREGHVGLQVVDQNQRLRGVFVPFFGELASTERAAVTLALRHGYPLLVGRCERVGRGFRFRVLVDEPFVPESTGDHAADVLRAAAEVNRRLEGHILACPEQYLWIHDRYRTRPGGQPDGAAESELEAEPDEVPSKT